MNYTVVFFDSLSNELNRQDFESLARASQLASVSVSHQTDIARAVVSDSTGKAMRECKRISTDSTTGDYRRMMQRSVTDSIDVEPTI